MPPRKRRKMSSPMCPVILTPLFDPELQDFFGSDLACPLTLLLRGIRRALI